VTLCVGLERLYQAAVCLTIGYPVKTGFFGGIGVGIAIFVYNRDQKTKRPV
jgi:hypothetical protein